MDRTPNSLSTPMTLTESNLATYYHEQNIKNNEFDTKTINSMIPSDLTPSNEATKVFNKIADKSINTILGSERFKQSSFGRMSEQVKDKSSAQVKFKSSLLSPVEHQFKAELDPFQGQTKLMYTGFFAADFIYKTEEYKINIQESIFNKKLYYENQLSKNIRTNVVGIKWDW